MNLDVNTVADILKTLIREDRAEIRALHESIWNSIYALVFASFVISGFLIGRTHLTRQLRIFTSIGDIIVIVLMGAIFYTFNKNLMYTRQALNARQHFLSDLLLPANSYDVVFPLASPYDLLFPDPKPWPPDLNETDMIRLERIAVLLVFAKMVLVFGFAGRLVQEPEQLHSGLPKNLQGL